MKYFWSSFCEERLKKKCPKIDFWTKFIHLIGLKYFRTSRSKAYCVGTLRSYCKFCGLQAVLESKFFIIFVPVLVTNLENKKFVWVRGERWVKLMVIFYGSMEGILSYKISTKAIGIFDMEFVMPWKCYTLKMWDRVVLRLFLLSHVDIVSWPSFDYYFMIRLTAVSLLRLFFFKWELSRIVVLPGLTEQKTTCKTRFILRESISLTQSLPV